MFEPIRGRRLAQAIVDQVREAIFAGRLLPGNRLPPERDLAKEFGASPVVVREALHALEAGGLLEIRHGASGGAFVVEMTHRALTESLSTLLRLGKATVGQITEARLVIEPEVAALAAARRRPEQLEPLGENLERAAAALDSTRDARLLNIEFHKLLVEVAGNPFFTVCLRALVESLEGDTLSLDLDIGEVTETLDYHRKIYRAIERGDARAAAGQMRRHIVQIQGRFERAERTRSRKA
jgi:DNA-binding FadR family transcriptional regulator